MKIIMGYRRRRPKNVFTWWGNKCVVYTDGSCINNGRYNASAGIGVYWGENNRFNVGERYHGKQTSQAAELGAAIRALEIANERNFNGVILFTDSNYVYKSMTSWIYKWQINGWKDVNGRPLSNEELFQELYDLVQITNADIRKVSAHSNIEGNEEADALARFGAEQSDDDDDDDYYY
ncbi:Ribonuclease H1 [Strongyloides ratti]|uniref:ribonuclease H n=1 Tax=Strongyloides ratti TaxID=34506 RepID=A0A090L5Y0_STRRB|nr:Ribonuclease H1 [Strongyloides ratti]CEF62914.1 Ribonuclease H1 [Strongyloides ratti]